MNCCDEYGNCRQGRDCPVRNEMIDQRMEKLEERYISWLPDPALGLLLCMGSAAGVISLITYLFYRFA
jgi:hypothetical protein